MAMAPGSWQWAVNNYLLAVSLVRQKLIDNGKKLKANYAKDQKPKKTKWKTRKNL